MTAALRPRYPKAFRPLAGVRVLSLALNLPGPAAAARLRALGAEVRKIEPPGGDPMRELSPALYRAMHRGVPLRSIDLKTAAGRQVLDDELRQSDLLLTAFRPAALRRLGLSPNALAARHPHLSAVAIVGYPGSKSALAGHDLTFQAEAGLIDASRLPTTLLADMSGALLVVEAAMGALLQARASKQGAFLQVALSDAAAFVAVPRALGLTRTGAVLGGELPEYGVYRCADGYVAIAALEPHFAQALAEAAGGRTRGRIARWCRAHRAAELDAIARRDDLPLRSWTA